MEELFLGNGIAHSILLFAIVIGIGVYLGRFKIKGISIGSTWILFIGILFSHFGFVTHPTVLSFMKDFGLILFVFSIGLQVGPGFFHSFKKDGVKLNLLSMALVLLAVFTTVIIHLVTKENLATLVGVMSGAVTNTPGLGAAQQTLADALSNSGDSQALVEASTSGLASAYAVAYPIGVLGVLALLIISKSMFKVDPAKEKAEIEKDSTNGECARRMHCVVSNPAIFGKAVKQIMGGADEDFVISRMLHKGKTICPEADTVLEEGDKVLVVTSCNNVDKVRIIFGEEAPMHLGDWEKLDNKMVTKKITVTSSSITGRLVGELNLRSKYHVTVTRVIRAGVEILATPGLILKVGDVLQVVGPEQDILRAAEIVGNKPEKLSHPNLVPIFLGIALGVILGSIPISFPGVPQPVKLGLAGGPLIVAILLGYFGPKWRITTYTTFSANMMIREIGISFFMAAVGLGAGQTFVSSIVNGGYWWILYGAIITLVPVSIILLVSRLVFKLNFYQICGLISGGTTDPAALAFCQGAYGTDYTSVNYATVYPLSMFLRVLVAQVLILFTL